jgi:pyrimidine-nucleoside phosphorylase
VRGIDTEAVGISSILLGAGRLCKEDSVDHGAGIIIEKKTGDKVRKGETLAVFYCGRNARFDEAKERFLAAYRIGAAKPKLHKLIHKEI